MAFEHEAARLRRLVKSGANVWFTRHAREEMAKDAVFEIDVITMLGRCSVSLVETLKEERWRAEGTDMDGRRLAAVVVAYEDHLEIKVVTAWTDEAKR